MKKVFTFLAIVVLIFAAIAGLNGFEKKQKLKDNPYPSDDLKAATIDQLSDPNYQNIILPDELKKSLENGETKTVYFFSPTCIWCQETTPIVVPLAEELGIDLKLFNLLEFEEGWDDYRIESTPTIVHYENGAEASRTVGYDEEEFFRSWFEENVLN